MTVRGDYFVRDVVKIHRGEADEQGLLARQLFDEVVAHWVVRQHPGETLEEENRDDVCRHDSDK